MELQRSGWSRRDLGQASAVVVVGGPENAVVSGPGPDPPPVVARRKLVDVDVNVDQYMKLFRARARRRRIGRVRGRGQTVLVGPSTATSPSPSRHSMSSIDDGTVDWTEKENVGRGASEPRRK